MDRNTVIGLVLIFLIMIGFGYLTQPSKEEREAYQRKADSIARVQEEEHRNDLPKSRLKPYFPIVPRNRRPLLSSDYFPMRQAAATSLSPLRTI